MSVKKPRPKKSAAAIAKLVARLPDGVRGFVERELDMGNKIADAGTGSPAPKGAIWVRMSKPFVTMLYALPKKVVYAKRTDGDWAAECTDPERRFFVMSGKDRSKSKEPPPARVTNFPGAAMKVRVKQLRQRATIGASGGVEDPISKVISEHLGLMWSKEIEDAIIHDVGKEGLARVREIDDFANRAEVWQYGSHDQAYAQIQRELAAKYPFLSAAAIQQLSTRAAWGWR